MKSFKSTFVLHTYSKLILNSAFSGRRQLNLHKFFEGGNLACEQCPKEKVIVGSFLGRDSKT